MPLPTPNNGESQDEFISRCMANPAMNSEYPEQSQRAAVCHSQWRRASKDQEGHDMIHKSYEAKLETVGEGERAVIAIVNTATLDRDKEIVLPKGADLTNYRKNPVVSWAHNYNDLPVAKTAPPGWIRYDRHLNALKAKSIFAEHEFADDIFKLYQGGFLRSFSIMFDASNADVIEPTKQDLKEHPEWKGAKRVYRKWELLDFSAVPIPSNIDALAVAVSKGLVTEKTANVLGIGLDTPEPEPVDSEPEPEEPAPRTVRRLISVPKRIVVRRSAWPRRPHLTTADEIGKMVKREIDRLRGRV